MLKHQRFIPTALISVAMAWGLNIETRPLSAGNPSLFSISKAAAQSQYKVDAVRLVTQAFQADNPKARLTPLQTALKLYRSQGDLKGEQRVLLVIGQTYYQLNNLSQAQSYLEQAIAVGRNVRPSMPQPSLQDIYQALGHVYLQQGETHKAIATFKKSYNREALQYPALYPSKRRELKRIALAHMDRVTAEILHAQGYETHIFVDPDARLASLQTALKLYQHSQHYSGETNTLLDIGWTYESLGQLDQAIAYLDQGIKVGEKNSYQLDDRTKIQVESAYGSLGSYAIRQGKPQDALPAFERMLTLAKSKEGWAYSSALANLGLAHIALEDHDKALQYLQQANRLQNTSPELLPLLGLAYFKVGDLQAAEKTLRQLIKPQNSNNAGYVSPSTLKPNKNRKSNTPAQIQEQITNLDQYRLRGTETYDVDTCGLLQKIYADQGKELVSLEFAEYCRGRALAQRLAGNENSEIATSFAQVESLDLSDIQKVAQKQQATIVQYSLITEDVLSISDANSSELLMWVIPPKGKITFRKVSLLNERESFRNLVAKARQSMGVRGRAAIVAKRQSGSSSTGNSALKQLHRLLIEPIAEALPQDPNAHVIFIPQGPLFSIPFPALTNASGQFLVDRHTILTAPSIHSLQFTRRRYQQVKKLNQKQVLVVGNPTMPLVVGNPTMPQYAEEPLQPKQTLPALPGSETEAQQVAALYKTKALIGSQATEAAITPQLSQARIIHLATHGLLDPPQKLFGRLWLSDFDNPSQLKTPGAIALAPGGGQDGLLTSDEIYRLKLNAELVVLSACDTGQGAVLGDGVVGLSRSLLVAGAPSILVSLWKVSDQATADLMIDFYQQLQSTSDKAQALRQAMLKTRQKYPDPADWAAFTLIGESG